MKRLKVNASEGPVTLDIFHVLQLRARNEPPLPRLKFSKRTAATKGLGSFVSPCFSQAADVDIAITKDSLAISSITVGFQHSVPSWSVFSSVT